MCRGAALQCAAPERDTHPHPQSRTTLPPPSSLPPSFIRTAGVVGRLSIASQQAAEQKLQEARSLLLPPAQGCWSSDGDGRGSSACRLCVSACRGSQTPGEPRRHPAVLRPAPAQRTAPSVWTPRPSPRASPLESSLCEFSICVILTVQPCMKSAGTDGH